MEGNTDNIGGDVYNLDLSKRRAAAVKETLVTRYHIAPDRLSTNGFGASHPIETNDTLEGRARNRRVELTASNRESMTYCTQCGKKVEEGVQFCTSCGARAKAAVQPAVPASVLPPAATSWQPGPVPPPQAYAPAKKRSGLALLLIFLGVLGLIAVAGIGGVVYVGYKVKQKVTSVAQQVTHPAPSPGENKDVIAPQRATTTM